VNTRAKAERAGIISIESIVDHGCVVSAGCHISPGSIVKGSSTVPKCMKIESGKVFSGMPERPESYNFDAVI